MRIAPLLSSIVLLTALSSGCVTGTVLEEARDHVYYKPRTVEDAEKPAEIDRVEKGKPALYALLPLTVAADVALLPVYVLEIVLVNVGILPVP